MNSHSRVSLRLFAAKLPAQPVRPWLMLICGAFWVCQMAPFAHGQQTSPTTPTTQPMAMSGAPTAHDAPPPAISAFIRAVAQSEHAMQPRRFEYTWTTKITDREVNKRGEVTKETVKVYEVYPVKGEFVRKLVSENGVPVSPEKAEEQLKRAVAKLEKAGRTEQKQTDSNAPSSAPADPSGIPSFGFTAGFKFRENFSTGEFYFTPARIMRAGEFVNPRHERLRERDVLVLDFRPRADFQPANDLQKPYAKLAGRIWLDVADKTVARLEAWPLAAAVVGNTSGVVRPVEPAIVYEETRLPDGMWLESLVRINTTGNKPVFNGVDVNSTKEAGDFKRFETNTGDAKVETAKPPQS